MSGTANVVVCGGVPRYIDDDLEHAQEVARELDDEYDDDVDLWKNVTHNIGTDTDGGDDE